MALIYWAHAGSPGDGTDGRWWEQTKSYKTLSLYLPQESQLFTVFISSVYK